MMCRDVTRKAVMLMCALMVAVSGLSAPRTALAASGYDPRVITLDGGYISRHALDGQEAYCGDSSAPSPTIGTTVSSWRSGPLMLDYVLYHAEGGPDVQWGWEPTRYAVWAIMENDLSFLTTYGSGEEMPPAFSRQVTAEYNAAKAWADAGGIGPERGCSRVYDTPSGYQPICVCAILHGYIQVHKNVSM